MHNARRVRGERERGREAGRGGISAQRLGARGELVRLVWAAVVERSLSPRAPYPRRQPAAASRHSPASPTRARRDLLVRPSVRPCVYAHARARASPSLARSLSSIFTYLYFPGRPQPGSFALARVRVCYARRGVVRKREGSCALRARARERAREAASSKVDPSGGHLCVCRVSPRRRDGRPSV